jgi:hypothetical protein
MPIRKFRYAPDDRDDDIDLPRLATEYDGYIPSPVHRMQDDLWLFADSAPQQNQPDLFPGWVRLTFPVVASGALWYGIYCVMRALR